MHTLNKIVLYYHTIKYLKWVQIRYQFYYAIKKRIFGSTYKLPQINKPKARSKLTLKTPFWVNPTSFYHPNTFVFLNQEQVFQGKMDWNYNGLGKLWTYNLNYFEFLHQAEMNPDQGLQLIKAYVAIVHELKDGLEPFPTSLRLLNWVKFLVKHQIEDEEIDQLIDQQTTLLLHNLEFHLLGNHLLENGFALYAVGVYFKNTPLLEEARSILEPQLEEQILPDGAHFELSPMYHQLMLLRLLDCINLSVNCHNPLVEAMLDSLKLKAGLMLGWLTRISFRNGSVPLFNDSAIGIAPDTKSLITYGQSLGIEILDSPLGASGYRKFQNEQFELIVDGGRIGPDYIPGHAHADITNFELYVSGQPFIVDTGISTYEKNERRQLERSTHAHNVVVVNNEEQSEVWSGFRVARRSIGSFKEASNNRFVIEIASFKSEYDGCQRHFDCSKTQIRIQDILPHSNMAVANFHFHPSTIIKHMDSTLITSLGSIEFVGAERIELKGYDFAPAFNIRKPASQAQVFFSGKLETLITL